MNSTSLGTCISLQIWCSTFTIWRRQLLTFFYEEPIVHWQILAKAKPVYGPPSPGKGKIIPRLLCEKHNKLAQERKAMFTIQSWLAVFSKKKKSWLPVPARLLVSATMSRWLSGGGAHGLMEPGESRSAATASRAGRLGLDPKAPSRQVARQLGS
jgi:hypothetical protein